MSALKNQVKKKTTFPFSSNVDSLNPSKPNKTSQDNWGVLPRNKDESVGAFIKVLEGFVNDLDVAMVNLHDSVQLHPCTVDLEAFKKPTDYVNAAHNPEIINSLESKDRKCLCSMSLPHRFFF